MNSWIYYAVLSAMAAGATAILAKVGIQDVAVKCRYRDPHGERWQQVTISEPIQAV